MCKIINIQYMLFLGLFAPLLGMDGQERAREMWKERDQLAPQAGAKRHRADQYPGNMDARSAQAGIQEMADISNKQLMEQLQHLTGRINSLSNLVATKFQNIDAQMAVLYHSVRELQLRSLNMQQAGPTQGQAMSGFAGLNAAAWAMATQIPPKIFTGPPATSTLALSHAVHIAAPPLQSHAVLSLGSSELASSRTPTAPPLSFLENGPIIDSMQKLVVQTDARGHTGNPAAKPAPQAAAILVSSRLGGAPANEPRPTAKMPPTAVSLATQQQVDSRQPSAASQPAPPRLSKKNKERSESSEESSVSDRSDTHRPSELMAKTGGRWIPYEPEAFGLPAIPKASQRAQKPSAEIDWDYDRNSVYAKGSEQNSDATKASRQPEFATTTSVALPEPTMPPVVVPHQQVVPAAAGVQLEKQIPLNQAEARTDQQHSSDQKRSMQCSIIKTMELGVFKLSNIRHVKHLKKTNSVALIGDGHYCMLQLNDKKNGFAPNIEDVTCYLERAGEELLGFADGMIIKYTNGLNGDSRKWQAHDNKINALTMVVIQEKAFLISASADKTIKIWRAANGCLTVLRGHTDAVNAVCVLKTDSNTFLISGGADKCLKCWDLLRNQNTFTLTLSASVEILTPVSDSQVLAALSDCTLYLWSTIDNKAHKLVGDFGKKIHSVAAVSSMKFGTVLAAISSEKGAWIYIIKNMEMIPILKIPKNDTEIIGAMHMYLENIHVNKYVLFYATHNGHVRELVFQLN